MLILSSEVEIYGILKEKICDFESVHLIGRNVYLVLCSSVGSEPASGSNGPWFKSIFQKDTVHYLLHVNV